MSVIKRAKRRVLSTIKSELCRIDKRCAVAGAVIILLCGILSAVSTGSFRLYGDIVQPKLAPPAFLFPIVWTFLYILIGGAAGAVACVRERVLQPCKFKGLLLFVIMMVFNFIWSPLFFGARAFFAALCAIVMMLLLTVLIIGYFRRIYSICAAVMVLYLIWLLFAFYLNLAVVILN